MKKYLFILVGVAFFSLLTSSNTFATDNYPTLDVSHIDLDNVQGFKRQASARGNTRINYSCKFQRVGEINVFPKRSYVENGETKYTTGPCGYAVFQGELSGPFDTDYNFQSYINFTSSRNVNLGNWYNTIVNSLYASTIYHSSSYVSAFQSIQPTYNFNTPNSSGGGHFDVPIADDDGYSFLIFTITNSYGDVMGYNTTAVAPLLSERAKDSLSIPGGGNGITTKDDIINSINGSATAGWVYEENGVKKNTFDKCQDQIDNGCTRIIPESDSFPAIQDYLDTLDVGTFFAVYAFPVFHDFGYSFNELGFSTPNKLSDYGVDFTTIDNEDSYWGLPFIYSSGYPNLNENASIQDPLDVQRYAAGISFLYIQPQTPEAFALSRNLAGNLVSAHNNAFRYQNGLSQLEPNPGGSFWGNIFNLGNIIFPLQSFLSGFSNQQCVMIPTLGSWLSADTGVNTQYCSWWSADIRNVLTPIFATSSMMLLFGFIVHWLRNGSAGLSSEKSLMRIGGKE